MKQLLFILSLFIVSHANGQYVGARTYQATAPNTFTHVFSVTTNHLESGIADCDSFVIKDTIIDAKFKTVSQGGSVTSVTGNIPNDIIFASNSTFTSYLAWQFDFYDSTTGKIVVWTRLANLSHSVDSVYYIGVGNSSITTFRGGNPWSSKYKMVLPLSNGTILSATDATTNGNDGTITGCTATSGIADGGAFFNGTTNYISVTESGATLSPTSGYISLSCWIYTDPALPPVGGLVGHFSNPSSYLLYAVADSPPWVDFTGGGTNTGSNKTITPISYSAWHYVVVVWHIGTDVNIFIDGALKRTASNPTGTPSYSTGFRVGYTDFSSSWVFKGAMDQARMYAGLISSSMDLAEYNNQKPSSDFLTHTLIY